MLQTQDGPLAEVTRTFHEKNGSVLNIGADKSFRSNIDRAKFKYWRKQYWRNRANDFLVPNGG
ncbi:HNH/ENDO VII family nuclease [Phyllobacterium zundukense]|uniref:HNH/ENDO VII family nuclease n=1 Tax=Phyllobacterium zundukense TaxID=1867719 RepID=A0ACD4D051_9HYPH|nr:HNH/ENDO VII family nuclease [Phyllobacterium zundukense]UXN59257.1 HNH/ENDO VII family nuclease [Phyllobacterium zundukense]